MNVYIRIAFIRFCIIILVICSNYSCQRSQNTQFRYTSLSRLTDPEENAFMLNELPSDIKGICDIANVQLVHYRMLSQWKIPRDDWNTASSQHDIKDILDTLKAKGIGSLGKDRMLENRINSACTKESIFLTGLLRHKGFPARIRIGYLTNLYKGEKAIEFWENVNIYERRGSVEMELWNSWTNHNKEVNRSIEHFVTEYWDENVKQWKLLDARPEFLEYHGVELEEEYSLKEKDNFEFAWQVWQRRDSIEEDAYAERGWSAKTHIRYQLLLDFYSLLNHDGPAIFESNGIQTNQDDKRRVFMEKDYDSLTNIEVIELDLLADLISKSPTISELLDFYMNSQTLKIQSIEEDKYSFVYLNILNTTANTK